MFDVQGVTLSYGARVILDDVSFKIEDGERAAIIGPNGTGKSTLLKVVAGVLQPESGLVSVPRNTEIGYLPQDLALESSRSVLEECRTIFAVLLEHEQEMRRLEDQMTHLGQDTPEFHAVADRYEYLLHETQRRDLYSMDATIGRVLSGLGFKVEEFDRPCDTFSGGWQMRINLAKLLLQNPDILLLDEPTNHLDIESIVWLTEWIRGHQGSVLMVSHERAFMDALATKILEIDRSRVVVYRGNFTDSLVKRDERRDLQRRTFENQQQQIAHIQKFIDRFRYQASKASLVQSRIKQLERIERVDAPEAAQDTIHFRFPPAPRSAKEVLLAEGIGKAYGKKRVLQGIDLVVYRGEKVALVGVNGAGKSTLMRILAGRDDTHEGKRAVGASVDFEYFAQYDREDLHPDNSVLEEFLSSAPPSVSDKARGILGAFLFSGDDVEKKVKVLSGGERTRLRLARMLCGRANLLLMDEPTNHLDIGSRLTLEEALRQYEGAAVLVSHDRYFLDNVVTRVIEISDGKATSYPGNYADYLAMKELAESVDGNTNGAAPRQAGVDAGRLVNDIASIPKEESAADRRTRQERRKQAKNRLRKVEKEIEEKEDLVVRLEEAIRELENEMATPGTATDHERLGKLTARLEKAKAARDEAEQAWIAFQEEREQLEAVLEE